MSARAKNFSFAKITNLQGESFPLEFPPRAPLYKEPMAVNQRKMDGLDNRNESVTMLGLVLVIAIVLVSMLGGWLAVRWAFLWLLGTYESYTANG
jgi:hypothetical protein